MSNDIFSVLDEDRESELKGEKATRLMEPFSPAILIDVSVSKNIFNSNCLSVILVKPTELGKYYSYDIEIVDKTVKETLKKAIDEKSKKRLVGLNISIMNINKHLYDLPGTPRTESTGSALSLLQKALTEKSIEVEVDFIVKPGEKYTNYYFSNIKGINFKDPIDVNIKNLIKTDLENRKAAQTKKHLVEKPNQFYDEVVQKQVVNEEDVPF